MGDNGVVLQRNRRSLASAKRSRTGDWPCAENESMPHLLRSHSGKVTTMTKKFMLVMIALSLSVPTMLLTGCNTVQGAGKDIESGGKAIKDEAQEHKRY